MVAMERICKECRGVFELTDEEEEKFSQTIIDRKAGSPTEGQEIQLVPPKRCISCRAKKRAAR